MDFFGYIDIIDSFLWSYLAIPAIIAMGFYLSCKARWTQITNIPYIFSLFWSFFKQKNKVVERGIHPLTAFFAAIGGCIGVGNVVGVCSAVQLGGPGAVFWMWVAAILGMTMKYAEIFLGMKYRVQNTENSYDGGPMYFLQHASSSKWLPKFAAFLLCIYGAEIYIFRIITHSVVTTWGLNHTVVVVVLLLAVLIANSRGMGMVGKISGVIIPLFLVVYCLINFWVFAQNYAIIPSIFILIFKSAFSGHAMVGGFLGSTISMSISNGMKRACYAGDIGIGYASVIHSETGEINPNKQALLGFVEIFLDSFVVCTTSVLSILITGVWNHGIHESMVVPIGLSTYIPHIVILWPFFIFLLGYSTVISFFAVGQKSAKFIFPKYGKELYVIYGAMVLFIFSYYGTESQLLTVMSCTGALLLLCNVYGIFKLRNEISFVLPKINR